MNNLRLALRILQKSPAFTAIVVLTLALGIGANTAIFSLVNATSLRPLPYPQPEQLVHVTEGTPQSPDGSVSYPNFLDWRAGADVFSALAIHRSEGVKLKTETSAEQVTALQVSQDFFRAVGVRPALGRELRPEDDQPGAAPVTWLTDAAWRKYFQADPEIVGRHVMLDGQATAVAGVLPAEFRFHRHADVYVPIEPAVDRQFMRMRENHNGTSVLGRLKPGVAVEAAAAQMRAIGERLAQEYPKANAGTIVTVMPLRQRLQGSATTNLYLLLGAVAMVLLIACVNVANMLLARSFSRRREMAIRTALGASRRELFKQLLTESLLLAALGGIVGAAIGKLGYGFVARLAPWEMRELMRGADTFDLGVWLFVGAAVLFTGVAFGLAPAWQLSHANPIDALKNTRPTVRTLLGRFHLADLLVLVQVALAVALLVASGLLIRSLQRLNAVPTGLQPDRVLTLQVATPPAASMTRDPGAFVRHHEAVLRHVSALPEIESAAFGSSLPYTWNTSSNWFFRPDRPLPEPGKFPTSNLHVVTPDYFRTMGIPLLQGELFDGREPRPPLPDGKPISIETIPAIYENFVVSTVISRRMAEQFWPGEDPVGKVFQLGQPEMRLPKLKIIGVVGNTTQIGAERGEQVEYYTLITQWPATLSLHLVAKTRTDPLGAVSSIRTAVRAAAPDEPVHDVRLMTERITGFSSDRRFSMGLFTFFAGTALLLATIGIYGVLACIVGQRTREIGIRMALGAQRSDVLQNVMARGLAMAVPGVALGLAAAVAAGHVLRSQLFGISSTDWVAYAASGGLLLVAAIAACAIPAQRAAKLDPVEALRTE